MTGIAPRFAFSCLLFLASLSFSTAHASERDFCESRLLAEFSQRPNDRHLGMITERVNMTPDSLAFAYQKGIFPWYISNEGNPVWASPPQRGILVFDDLHVSRTDREFIAKALQDPAYEVTFDKAFREVMTECANMIRWRKLANGDRIPDGQWISPEFVDNYTRLFERGQAHSVEVWHNGILVGGLYGTFIKGVFAGESMFHKENNVTKLAMYKLIERLQNNGHWFIDTQQAKGLSEKWGAKLVPRATFETMLAQAQGEDRPF